MSSGRTRVLFFLMLCFAALQASARAEDIAVGASPILDVQLASGSLAVHVWSRSAVRITTTGRIDWRHLTPPQIESHIPTQISFWAQQTTSPYGPVMLPLESFVLPWFPGVHDALIARGYGQTTITLPEGTALVVARISEAGGIAVSDYRGTLIATTNGGTIHVQRFVGTAYFQVLRGRIVVEDSAFDRVRARSGAGPVIFSMCRASQIDATTVVGAVLYDDGTLGAGPAHFASQFGNVAIGISGANAEAHRMAAGSTTVTFGAESVATVSTEHGRIFTYSGTLTDHRDLLGLWPRGAVLLLERGSAPVGQAPVVHRPFRPLTRRPRPPSRGRPASRR